MKSKVNRGERITVWKESKEERKLMEEKHDCNKIKNIENAKRKTDKMLERKIERKRQKYNEMQKIKKKKNKQWIKVR